MGELLLIAANARYFTDSAGHVPQDVGNGQAAAGMAIDFYGRVFEESVGPDRCRFVARAPPALPPDPVAVLLGVLGERLAVAPAFVECLLTAEAQRLGIPDNGTPGGPVAHALRRPPIRRDLYAGSRAYWTDDVNPYDEAGGFNARAEWSSTLGDNRLIWGAAWMDARSALKDAHARVLAVADPARQRDLLARLADLPITRDDVEDLRTVRKRMEKDDTHRVEEWKAAQRIEWARKFRAHYAAVEAAAAGGEGRSGWVVEWWGGGVGARFPDYDTQRLRRVLRLGH